MDSAHAHKHMAYNVYCIDKDFGMELIWQYNDGSVLSNTKLKSTKISYSHNIVYITIPYWTTKWWFWDKPPILIPTIISGLMVHVATEIAMGVIFVPRPTMHARKGFGDIGTGFGSES